MQRLIIATLAILLACPPVMAAEPEDAADTGGVPAKPADTAPKEPVAPKKIEYDKLTYPALLKRARGNDPEAQFELGSRHNYGRDLPKNTREAVIWLRKAAEAGHAGAQRLLAVKLYEVVADQEEAFRWVRRLADAGDRPGQVMLGNLYANGEGTPRDLVRAYMWFDIAASPITGKELDESASRALKSAQDARDQTRELLQPEEEIEAQRLASNWWLQKYAPTPAKARKKAGSRGRLKAVAKK